MKFEKIPGIWFSLSGIVYALGVIASLIFASNSFTIGFVAGGALVLVNSLASIRRLRHKDLSSRGRLTVQLLGGFYARLIVIAVCLYGLIVHLHINPFGIIAGLSIVPVGLLSMPILIYIANRRPEEA